MEQIKKIKTWNVTQEKPEHSMDTVILYTE